MSTGRQGQLHERLPAHPESIAPMRHAIVGFAADNGASDSELEDIALAVSEALTNVVVGMRPRADSSGLGHGLSVINRITEQLRVEDAKPGVRMRMTFAIGWG